jgi:hypothetical protein
MISYCEAAAIYGPCSNKARSGSKFCGVHSPEAVARRRARSAALDVERLKKFHRSEDITDARSAVVEAAIAWHHDKGDLPSRAVTLGQFVDELLALQNREK